MERADLRAELVELIEAHIEVPEADDAPLGLSSLALVELAEDLEERFGFLVRASDVTPDNFGSLGSLVAFVARKRGAP